MTTLIEILIFIAETLGTLFLLFVLLRFLLQMARADFYNPFSQAVVKVTNPVLIPLRKILPGIFGIDVASIVLAIAVQVLVGEIVYLLYTGGLFNPLTIALWGLLGNLMVCTYIALVCILVIVVASFVAPYSSHPAILLSRQLMEPIIAPVQKVIPPAGGLDFSVFFVGMGIYIVQKILAAVAASMQLLPTLIIGF